MKAIAPERLAEVFVEVADTLVDDFDLSEFLQTLISRTTELSGFQAAGLLLAGPGGQLRLMAASEERVHLLELFVIQSDQGPCRDSYQQGVQVSSVDLRESGERWPAFAPAAVEAGFRGAHAFPLKLRQQVIGSVGLFSREAATLSEADGRIVQALSEVATIALLQERATRREEVLTQQLGDALEHRSVIEQAKGVIAHTYGVSIDDGYALLRSYCRDHRLRLSDVARDIVTDPANAADLRAGR